MALTPQQIASAAAYFTTKNSARAQAIATAPRPLPGQSSGGGGAKAGGVKGGPPVKPAIQNPATNRDFNFWDLMPWNGFGASWAGRNITSDLIESPMEKNEAPTNASQWVLNLLSTGVYAPSGAAANVVESIQNDAKRGDVGFPQTALNAAGAGLGGFWQGIFEGFGGRVGDQRPTTWGRNLDEWGATDAMRQGSKDLFNYDKLDSEGRHAVDVWNDISTGVTGFGADVVLDPLTYVGGLGLVKGLRGGVAAAGNAIREGEKIVPSLVKGAREIPRATAAAQTEQAALQVEKQIMRQERRAGTAPTTAFTADMMDPTIGNRIDEVVPEVAPVSLIDDTIPGGVMPSGNPVDPRFTAASELLPNITATTSRDVPVEAILTGAAQSRAGTPPAVAKLLDATKAGGRGLEDAVTGLRTSPAGIRFLEQEITVGGNKLTVLQAATRAATHAQAGRGGDAAALINGIETAAQKLTGARVTPDTLAASIETQMPGAEFDLGSLVDRIAGVKTQAARRQILADTLGVETRGFATFDEAIAAGVDGQLELETMREMLKALGIKSRLNASLASVRKALDGEGRATWQELQQGIPTLHEVFTDNGIPAASALDALDVNVNPAIDMNEAFIRDTATALDLNPTTLVPSTRRLDSKGQLRPSAGASVGNAIFNAIEDTAHRILKAPSVTEAYGTRMAVDAHSSIMRTLGLSRGGKTGRERGEVTLPEYLTALKTHEASHRRYGVWPRIEAVDRAGSDYFFSYSQILEALPESTVKQSLFDSMKYSLGKEVGAEAYQKGLSTYPSTIMDGAREAMDGVYALRGTEELRASILETLIRSSRGNQFQQSAEGVRALEDLADALSSPQFTTYMKAMHEAQAPVATKFMLEAVDGALQPVVSRILTAVGTATDRGEIFTAIRSSYNDLAKLSASGQPALVRDLSLQQLDNALINGLLDQKGVSLMRYDGRAKEAIDRALKNAELRDIHGENLAKLGEDMSSEIDAQVEALALSMNEADAVNLTELYAQLDTDLGRWATFSKIGEGLEGSFGVGDDVNTLRAGTIDGARDAALAMQHSVEGWNRNAMRDLAAARGVESVTPEAVTEFSRSAIRSLGNVERAFPNLPDEQLFTVLQKGVPMNARSKPAIHTGTAGLSEGEARLAMQLRGIIREVFAPSVGPLSRAPITADDLLDQLNRFGFGANGPLAGLRPSTAKPLSEQSDLWMALGDAGVADPLGSLVMFQRAMGDATIRPAIGSRLAARFGHRGLDDGRTVAQLRTDGWREVDQSSGSLARHIPKGTLLPPEEMKILARIQHTLDSSEKSIRNTVGGSNFGTNVIAPAVVTYDILTGIWKPMMTVWNLAHHFTNIMGENLMLLAAGVNPMHSVRSIKMLAATGAIKVDPGTVEAAIRKSIDAAGGSDGTFHLSARFADPQAQVKIGNGYVTLSPEQVAAVARENGVMLTPHRSLDLPGTAVDPSVTGRAGAIQRTWAKATNSKFNLAARATRKIGQFSAARDNVTRLAHFYSALESRPFKNMTEAVAYASEQVLKFHPTVGTMSVFEQKVARRAFSFYTWMRQATGTILRTMLDDPSKITLLSKWNYEMGLAAGMDPESIGKPIPDDPRIASYYQNGLLGPMFLGGNGPIGSGDLEAGEEPNLWGYSLNSPQIDTISNLFGSTTFGGDPMSNYRQLAANLNPLLRVPGELAFNTTASAGGRPQAIAEGDDWAGDYMKYGLSQTGVVDRLAGALGVTGDKSSWTDAQNAGERQRKLINWLTGLKYTNYTNPTSATVAANERAAWEKQQLASRGYTPEQIKEIRKYWKEYRAYYGE